jgi:hypothetical protein
MQLHWLPVKSRIKFKILLLTYKSLHALAPRYLSDLLHPYTPLPLLHGLYDLIYKAFLAINAL